MANPKDAEWKVTCARCGRTIPGTRSHLFWTPAGTYRTCGGSYERKCARLANEQARTREEATDAQYAD
jgi:hypothetical protein